MSDKNKSEPLKIDIQLSKIPLKPLNLNITYTIYFILQTKISLIIKPQIISQIYFLKADSDTWVILYVTKIKSM